SRPRAKSARKVAGHAAGKARSKRPPRSTPTVKPSRTARPPSVPSQSASSGSAVATWTPAAGEVGVRVRMYRGGFGDFFVVTFLDDAGKPVHVIIDCGVFKGTSQTGDIGSIEADMARLTHGEVALIIMTHRHADHIAGFARCAETFRGLTVGGVWMPIWESEYEPTALKFQAERTRTALQLRQP